MMCVLETLDAVDSSSDTKPVKPGCIPMGSGGSGSDRAHRPPGRKGDGPQQQRSWPQEQPVQNSNQPSQGQPRGQQPAHIGGMDRDGDSQRLPRPNRPGIMPQGDDVSTLGPAEPSTEDTADLITASRQRDSTAANSSGLGTGTAVIGAVAVIALAIVATMLVAAVKLNRRPEPQLPQYGASSSQSNAKSREAGLPNPVYAEVAPAYTPV